MKGTQKLLELPQISIKNTAKLFVTPKQIVLYLDTKRKLENALDLTKIIVKNAYLVEDQR